MTNDSNLRQALDGMRERVDAAVSGPWFFDGTEGRLRVYQFALIEDSYSVGDGYTIWQPPSSYRPEQIILETEVESWDEGEDDQDDQIRANAEFVAAARTDLPRLLAAVEKVRRLCLAASKPEDSGNELLDADAILEALTAEIVAPVAAERSTAGGA